MLRRPTLAGRLDDVLDTLGLAAYDFVGAWLTIESRSSIEARRLEGLLLRGRVGIVAAPERGAARRWCACTAHRPDLRSPFHFLLQRRRR